MIKIDRYFASGESIGIKYDDEDLAIDWKIDKKFVILSEADKKLSNFKDIKSPFIYGKNYY